MHLRKATDLDKGPLREWRIANAEYFPPGPKITVDSHLLWWKSYVNRPWDHMYMVVPEEGGDPVGTISVNMMAKTFERVMRGRPEHPGIMGKAIYELLNLYGGGDYMVQVLEGNDKAIKFYEKLGFRIFGRQEYKPPLYKVT